MRFQLVARRFILASALGLALAVAVAACSSSSSSSGSAPATSAPAASASGSTTTAQITANWEKFFDSTSTSQRVALLQNGSAFAGAIGSLSHLASGLGATVNGVTVVNNTAVVNYNITSGGKSLLPGQLGTAVYENGVWKVGDGSLCGLLKLAPGATLPAACSSAS
jgi:ABC-type phosphate transport system substrate-binding protein